MLVREVTGKIPCCFLLSHVFPHSAFDSNFQCTAVHFKTLFLWCTIIRSIDLFQSEMAPLLCSSEVVLHSSSVTFLGPRQVSRTFPCSHLTLSLALSFACLRWITVLASTLEGQKKKKVCSSFPTLMSWHSHNLPYESLWAVWGEVYAFDWILLLLSPL